MGSDADHAEVQAWGVAFWAPVAAFKLSCRRGLHSVALRRITPLAFVIVVITVAIRTMIRIVRALSYKQRLAHPDDYMRRAAQHGWDVVLEELKRSRSRRHMVLEVQFGLGNRLRALASGMAIAAASQRPLLVIWPPDLHCNCSFRQLFSDPLPFALIEEPTPPEILGLDLWHSGQDESASLTPGVEAGQAESAHLHRLRSVLQVMDLMNSRNDTKLSKNRAVHIDPARHLVVRSAFLINHARGTWAYAKWQLRVLSVAKELEPLLVADTSFVGIHVRSVFDAPRDAATSKTPGGEAAMAAAKNEYGAQQSQALELWRNKGRWPQFVRRIAREPAQTKFYLAADSQDAYEGLMSRFPDRMIRTPRSCTAPGRCDFRDCTSVRIALVDMLNLARTRRILGSYYSSFSEAAAVGLGVRWPWGTTVPREYAGKDFGDGIDDNL